MIQVFWKKLKTPKYRLPILPISALVFYLGTMILWKFKLIPSPVEILKFLELLYSKYGYFGLALATFLESIVYLGLYFPGSLIIALAVFFSGGTLIELLIISIVVAAVLTVTALINYLLGGYISSRNFWEKKELMEETEFLSKDLFVSMLHPNLLAFFFFNEGLEKRNLKKIIYVPLFMIPYGFLFALFLSKFSNAAKESFENPKFLFIFILVWITASFIFENKRNKNPKVKNRS